MILFEMGHHTNLQYIDPPLHTAGTLVYKLQYTVQRHFSLKIYEGNFWTKRRTERLTGTEMPHIPYLETYQKR
jgi:hypothetical protein